MVELSSKNPLICGNYILANKVNELANNASQNAISKMMDFHYPSMESILGPLPQIPTNADINTTLKTAVELMSYYENASLVEAEFSRMLKEGRA